MQFKKKLSGYDIPPPATSRITDKTSRTGTSHGDNYHQAYSMFVSGASVTHGFIVHRVVRTPINKCSLQSCAGFAAGSSTRTSHGTEKTKSATDKIHVVSNHSFSPYGSSTILVFYTKPYENILAEIPLRRQMQGRV